MIIMSGIVALFFDMIVLVQNFLLFSNVENCLNAEIFLTLYEYVFFFFFFQNWKFLTRFCFLSNHGMFEYEIEYPKVRFFFNISF